MTCSGCHLKNLTPMVYKEVVVVWLKNDGGFKMWWKMKLSHTDVLMSAFTFHLAFFSGLSAHQLWQQQQQRSPLV